MKCLLVCVPVCGCVCVCVCVCVEERRGEGGLVSGVKCLVGHYRKE